MQSPLTEINSNCAELPSPPPLQLYTSNVSDNVSIENNKENIQIPSLDNSDKSNTTIAVPPLELLTEDKIDTGQQEEKHIEEVEEVEEIEESGDIIPETSETNNNNNQNNNNQSNDNNISDNENNSNMNVPLSSTGRLLESEAEWQLRPKVSFDNLNRMTFRPLRMKCTHCTEAFTKTHDLYAHIRTHQDHTKCPHCGKILTCMATFVYHVRTHTTEKPYYCPVTDCEFKNAVKYNLKVHLACIRHGGKDNLKKYAKVLDLDVCEKSLRKRKDNSVHELGSRRSRKRRKLNINKSKNNNEYNIKNEYNTNMNDINEYDQFATQLLFSLSGMPPVFDPQINQMNHLLDWNTIISPQNEMNIKSENQNEINNINIENIKHEPQYYDPALYGYYMNTNINTNTNTNINTNTNTITDTPTSASTSAMWSTSEPTPQIKLENDINNSKNNDSLLLPKQELITNDSYINPMNGAIPTYINDTHSYPINYFHYPHPYYINYDPNALLLYQNHPSNNQINNQINNQRNETDNNNEQTNSKNNTLDIPPLPIPYQNGQWTANNDINKKF